MTLCKTTVCVALDVDTFVKLPESDWLIDSSSPVLQIKYDSNKAKKSAESLLPTAKQAPHFDVSDMTMNSEAYSMDQHTSHLPLRII